MPGCRSGSCTRPATSRCCSCRCPRTILPVSWSWAHGLPFLKEFRIEAEAPGWSTDFDAWAGDALARGDVDALASYQSQAPGMPYAHPTVEHYTPLFVTLGAATDPEEPGLQVIDGFWMGLSKRSLQVA